MCSDVLFLCVAYADCKNNDRTDTTGRCAKMRTKTTSGPSHDGMLVDLFLLVPTSIRRKDKTLPHFSQLQKRLDRYTGLNTQAGGYKVEVVAQLCLLLCCWRTAARRRHSTTRSSSNKNHQRQTIPNHQVVSCTCGGNNEINIFCWLLRGFVASTI